MSSRSNHNNSRQLPHAHARFQVHPSPNTQTVSPIDLAADASRQPTRPPLERNQSVPHSPAYAVFLLRDTPAPAPAPAPAPPPPLSSSPSPSPSPSTMPPTHSPPSESPSGPGPRAGSTWRAQDYEGSRRHKRRKLDPEAAVPAATSTAATTRYGRYGQVEPGPLTMDIIFHDPPTTGRAAASPHPRCMLDNSESIYYTDARRFNVILAHMDAIGFQIQSLVITTSTKTASVAPVRGGVVFTSMQLDEILARTTQYNIPLVWSDSASSIQDGNEVDMYLGNTFDFLTDSASHRNRGAMRAHARRNMLDDEDDEEDDDEEDPDDETLHRIARLPTEWISQEHNTFMFCDYNEEVPSDNAVAAARATQSRLPSNQGRPPPNHIGNLPFETDSTGLDSPNVHNILSLIASASAERRNLVDGHALPPSGPGLADIRNTAQDASTDMLTPAAIFEIAGGNNRCYIKFDRPLRTRYLLLKFWSSHEGHESMAIHSVVVSGFAGPRYVPAMQLM